jgi:hypothetical protein
MANPRNMIIGTGIPITSPVQRKLKLSGNPEKRLSSPINRAKPENIINNPNVLMNGGNFKYKMKDEPKTPETIPTDSPKIKEITNGNPISRFVQAVMIDVKAITDPTDRSIPPDIMTNVMPIDNTPIIDAWVSTFFNATILKYLWLIIPTIR